MGRYKSQLILKQIGTEGQQRLLSSHAVIIGLGALGTVSASNLVRAGVGRLTLIDRDIVELSNLQRQIIYTEEDLGEPKVERAAAYFRKVNPSTKIEARFTNANSMNIVKLINGADVVIDGTDNLPTRLLINEAAVKLGVPWVYGGAVESRGMVMNIIPGVTPCFRCVFDEVQRENGYYTCDAVGVLNSLTGIVANLQSNEALKIILGSEKVMKGLIYLDVWDGDLQKAKVVREDNCPVCQRGEYRNLEQRELAVDLLCGKGSVQIVPCEIKNIDLSSLASKLKNYGSIEEKKFLLRFGYEELEMTIFRDGRAIVKGTEDSAQAEELYARFVVD